MSRLWHSAARTAKEKPQQGVIVAVGAGRRDEKGKLIPMDVKVDDKVLYANIRARKSRSTIRRCDPQRDRHSRGRYELIHPGPLNPPHPDNQKDSTHVKQCYIEEARRSLKRGVDKLADAVSTHLALRAATSRSTEIACPNHYHEGTVAQEIELRDAFENMARAF